MFKYTSGMITVDVDADMIFLGKARDKCGFKVVAMTICNVFMQDFQP